MIRIGHIVIDRSRPEVRGECVNITKNYVIVRLTNGRRKYIDKREAFRPHLVKAIRNKNSGRRE